MGWLVVGLVLAADVSTLENRYLVIVTEGGGTDVSARTRDALPSPERAQRVSTTALANLKPCIDITIADAFERKADAVALVDALARLKITAYVKNAGKYVPGDAKREATCARLEAQRATASRATVLVGVDGDVLLPLGVESTSRLTTEVAGQEGSPPAFIGTIPRDPSQQVKKNDRFRVVGPSFEAQVCRVVDFRAVRRGAARVEGLDTPCNQTMAFARLDCPTGGSLPAVAVPLPSTAEALAVTQNDALARKATTWLSAHPLLRSAIDAGDAEAKERDTPLNRADEVEVYASQTGARVVVFRSRLTTGEGNDECGATDFHREPVVALFYAREDAEPREVFQKDDWRFPLEAVFDLAGDGSVTFLWNEFFPDARHVLRTPDWRERSSDTVLSCVPFGC